MKSCIKRNTEGKKAKVQEFKSNMILLILFLEKSEVERDRVEWYEYMGSR